MKDYCITFMIAVLLLALAGCGPDPFYIEVSSIEGVPKTGTAGTPLALTGTIRPAFASNKNIVWSVVDAGTTGASISGNILNTEAVGTVTIRATVANGIAEGKAYTQDFLVNIVEGETEGEPITEVGIFLTGPAKGEAPDTAAGHRPEDGDTYTVGAVSWSPAHELFQGETEYTATVTLTANEGYTFTGLADAFINGESAIISNNTGKTVTVSYTFAPTLDKVILGIMITSQPTKMTYAEGEALDISGLVVWLTFSDGSSEFVAYDNFGAYNITSVPAHGEALTTAYNGKQIVVSVGGQSAYTFDMLTVNAAGHTGGIQIQGDTLAAQLTWLHANVTSNTTYDLELKLPTENISPQNFSYSGLSNVVINLNNNSGSERIVAFSSNGELLKVEGDVTLVLNENVTLQGRSNNTGAVIQVANGGTLIINDGAKITGNTKNSGGAGVGVGAGTFIMNGGEITGNKTTLYEGGGVRVGGDGTFIMNGGKIHGNTSSDYGGGLFVSKLGGTNTYFIMNGGEIYNNTAKYGGGVSTSQGATFRMTGGTIYGSNEPEGLKNIATSSNAALYKYSGNSDITQYGTFINGVWTSNGSLSNSSNTIKVVNGLLLP